MKILRRFIMLTRFYIFNVGDSRRWITNNECNSMYAAVSPARTAPHRQFHLILSQKKRLRTFIHSKPIFGTRFHHNHIKHIQ